MPQAHRPRAPKADPEEGQAAATPTTGASAATDGGGEAARTEPQAPQPEEAEFSHSMLFSKGQALLPGANPNVVRAVLSGAPDPISLADVQARIQRFLTSPVTTNRGG